MCHFQVQETKPVPLPRKKYCASTTQMDHPPELPARESLDPRKEQPCPRTNGPGDTRGACNGVPLAQPAMPSVDQHQPKNQEAKSAINLAQLKKKFQKMRGVLEEHTYAEINDTDGQELLTPRLGNKDGNKMASENEYEELHCEPTDSKASSKTSLTSGSSNVSKSKQPLPSEYLPPPPFAPGY